MDSADRDFLAHILHQSFRGGSPLAPLSLVNAKNLHTDDTDDTDQDGLDEKKLLGNHK